MVCIIEQARVSADEAEPRLFLRWMYPFRYGEVPGIMSEDNKL